MRAVASSLRMLLATLVLGVPTGAFADVHAPGAPVATHAVAPAASHVTTAPLPTAHAPAPVAARSGFQWDESQSAQYGEDFFVFKREAVKGHLTFYPTDSLSGSAHPEAPSIWTHALQPWDNRMLLAAGLEVDQGHLQLAHPHLPGLRTGIKIFQHGSTEEWKGDAATGPHSVLRIRWAMVPRAEAA